MIQFKENTQTERRTEGQTEGQMDRPYFMGPFQLPPGVQKELELQERHLQIAQDQQNKLLTNLMAQNKPFLAVISNITGKK